MIITTTPTVDGKRIREYRGIVTGEAIMGANIFRDLFAGLRDIVGGRSAAYEKELRTARETAMAELAANAQELERTPLSALTWTTKYWGRIMACSWSASAGPPS